MSQDRFQLMMDLFQEALPLSPEERVALLDRRCEGDGDLRAEVEAMLSHDERPAASLKSAGGGVKLLADRIAPRVLTAAHDQRTLPVLSGQYRVIRIIGEGGMGTVYEAEQARPRRTVALKSIRPGLVTRQMLARLEREAEVLGRLHHPGIAQVYEAGAADPTREDQAYFAMEFIRGQPLTAHCESHRLDLRQRWELVAKVCDAVQHAHERRVVHRDLKPGNILVDGSGQPKVLDFGVARALDADGGGATLHTVAGQLVGTLPYMSPEQVGADASAVDERSDVYSLGVILYQLATGKLPHDHTGRSIPESARVIRDEAPARPSSLNPRLRGDVETIICKALEKDRGRRYQSAAALGEDIRRWLAGDAIAAKEDSAFYVLTKQMKRHRASMSVVAAAFLALAAFAVYSAAQSRKNALLAERESAARAEAEAARKASDRQLRSSNIERGRLLGMTGNLAGAESLIWAAHREEPTSQSHWALWELYSRNPCVFSVPGHNNFVRAVAASPSGREIASAAQESEVRIWSMEGGALDRTIDSGTVTLAMRYLPGTGTLITAGLNGTLQEWDTRTGLRLHSVAVPGGRLLSICLLGNTGKVAVGCNDGGVRIVSLETWTVERTLVKTTKVLRAVSSNASGTVLAVAGEDGHVYIWDVVEGQLLRDFKAHDGTVSAMSMNANASMLATGGPDKILRLWSLSPEFVPSEPVELKWTNGWVRCLEFTRDGTQLLAAGFWRVEVWDVSTRALASDVTLVEQPPWVAAFSPDQALIITGAENGSVRAWEKQSLGALRRTFGVPGEAETLALSPDGRFAAVSGSADGDIQLSTLIGASLEPLKKLNGHRARAAGLAFTPDGKQLVSAGIDGAVKLWDIGDLSKEARQLPGSPDDNIVSICCSPDGRGIAYSTRRGGINLVDFASGKNRTISEPAASPVPEVLRVSFNADGTSLAATRRVKWLEFYDPVSGALQWKGITDAPVWSLQFLTGTDLFAVGTWDSGIEVWSESKRVRVGKLSGHTRVVSALAWKPADERDEGMLASASSDGTLKLWSVSSGTCLATLRPEAGAVTGVAFVPGQPILLSTHADGTVGRWDLAYYNRHIEAAGRVQGGEVQGVK